jgi:hypothetical protein
MAGKLVMEEGLDPTAPATGYWNLYPKTDGLYQQDDADNKTRIQTAAMKGVASGIASLDGSAVVPDAQISEASVTQHEAALAIAATQLTGSIDDARVQESNVTQHEAALSIATTQVTGTLPAAQCGGPAVTAVGATHTFASGDNGKLLHIDDGTALVVTLPASGVATNTSMLICCTSTGDLTFTVSGTAHFDSVAYAAGPTATGKFLVSITCLASGVYYISGELDLV